MATPYVLSSDLVSAYPAKSLAIAQYIDGYKLDTGPVQNAQTGTTYTFLLTDTTKTVTANNSAASAYTVPPQSSVVWEDYTTLRLLNLGAGVVTLTPGAGVTINGTATVAQYASATLVRTASNTWTVAGSGTAPGMVLITPTSVAGTGVTLSGGQVNFSAAATISANGCFTATYDTYLVQTQVSAASTAIAVNLRMRAAGTDNASSNYFYNGLVMGSSSETLFSPYRSAGSSTGWQFLNTLTDDSFSHLYLSGPAQTFLTNFHNVATGVNATDMFYGANGGRMSVTTAYDGLSLIPSSGNITGTLRIYGLRNS